jgi:glycosyltransferase involved in cell wall biosynthesis
MEEAIGYIGMNIIYVENVRMPSERAHAYQIVQLCAWLGRFGHRVTLVNPDRAGGRDVFAYFGIADRPFTHVVLPSWDALAIPVKFLKPIAYALQRFFFVQAFRTWSRGKTADAWYTRDPAMIDGLRNAVQSPWVLELHDAPDHVPERWRRVKPFVREFVVISNGLKEDLVKRLGIPEERIVVAPDGFDPAEFEDDAMSGKETLRQAFGLPVSAFVAIYAGSFYPWKGVDLVVRAWAQTPPNAHLVLIGGPPGDRERLARLVDARVRDRIHIYPYVSRPEIVRWLRAADVGLLTSSPAHEIARAFTSPIKQFEYLAAGLPIIASDVPSSHEVLTTDVATFYKPSESGFVDAFRKTMEDASWRASAARRTRELVRGYSWEARARSISETIERVAITISPI